MNFFIAYRFTGEDPKNLERTMKIVCNALKEAGHNYYCTLWEDNSFQNKTKIEIMKHAFQEIDKSDGLFVFVNSDERSEGMLMEIGYCLAKNKKVVLAIKKNIKNTYLREISNKVIEFSDLKELNDKIKKSV